VVRPLKINYGG